MELKGSRTEANLLAAFAGESEARNKYTFYASKARKDGYEKVAQLKGIGKKFDRWYDLLWMQKKL